jgi:hypothetical protein
MKFVYKENINRIKPSYIIIVIKTQVSKL